MQGDESLTVVHTALGASLFALVFLFGQHIHPVRPFVRDRQGTLSFCAGMSAAYVFVHLLPELHEARTVFAESTALPLRREGMLLYAVALIGFLVFYGLAHLRRVDHVETAAAERRRFRLHLGGVAAYVGLTAYLLVHGVEGSSRDLWLYALAFAVHFLTIEHSMHEEYGHDWTRRGRWVVAASCMAGWLFAQFHALPPGVLSLTIAFVAGAVIVNSAVSELPGEREGRLLPFVCGGVIYAAVLLQLA